jgi:hypothetical protein
MNNPTTISISNIDMLKTKGFNWINNWKVKTIEYKDNKPSSNYYTIRLESKQEICEVIINTNIYAEGNKKNIEVLFNRIDLNNTQSKSIMIPLDDLKSLITFINILKEYIPGKW